jgi:ribosomal protein S16
MHNTIKYFATTVIVMMLIAFSYNACTYDVSTPNICFQEDILPIFVSKCANNTCHNSVDKASGYDFSNYDGIIRGVKVNKPDQSEAYTAVNSGEMPPSSHPQLDKLEKTMIKNWIKSGAPNSSNCYTCDTSNYTFGAVVNPLIDKWCLSCHTDGNAGAGHNFKTYFGIKNSISTGRFVGSIQHQAGYSPMPQNSDKLPACDMDRIINWVNAGAPNN